MSNFKDDLSAEKELGEYLDKYLYDVSPDFTDVKRIKETQMDYQYSGIDVEASYDNEEMLIDEKGYLSSSKIMNTFALEISYLNPRNERVEGWLFDPRKKTTHYLFCWNKRDKDIDHKEVKEKDFHYVIAMLVARDDLINYLNTKYGINQETSQEKVNEILSSNKTGPIDKIGDNTTSKYFYSNHLAEKPINIVLNKKELQEIAIFHKLVKRSELKDAW